MAGKSLLAASEEQRVAVMGARVNPRDRGEADRARAGGWCCWTLAGWTSPRIAEAFGVREDTVRVRGRSAPCGAAAWRREGQRAPGPAPVSRVKRPCVSSHPCSNNR